MKTFLTASVAVALFGSMAVSAQAGGIFAPGAYSPSFTFADKGPGTTMTLAFDGTNYYSSNGGGSSSPLDKYTSAGAFIASTAPTPGIDFRSVFTNASGNLFARGYSNPTIYEQTSFGQFSPFVTLSGGSLDSQSAVVQNIGGTGYIAQSGGVVDRWNASGAFLGSTNLVGFGGTESNLPQGRGIAVDGNDWLTFDSSTDILSAWNTSGTRVGTTTLSGAGTGFDSGYSYSFANGLFFVVDQAGGTWRGYNINSGILVPEPASMALLGAGLAGLAVIRRRKPR